MEPATGTATTAEHARLAARIRFPAAQGRHGAFSLTQGSLNQLHTAVKQALGEHVVDGALPNLSFSTTNAKKDKDRLATWLGVALLRASSECAPDVNLRRWQESVMALAVGGCTRSSTHP